MKAIKNITTVIVTLAMVLLNACEPIEDRELLKNSYNPDDIELEVIQTAGGVGNGLTLKMNTPGVIGYWNYLIDRKYTNVVEVVFPIPGTHTFTYTVSTPYIIGGDPGNRETITKTIDVTIEELDQPLPKAYYDLIGDDLEGKTWVFDGAGGDGKLWWFMSDPGNPWGLWWNAGGECCPPTDASGKMVFDLDGAANYTYFATAGGAGVTGGSFSFNADFSKLTISGTADLLGVNGCGAHSNGREYNIVEFSDSKLVLSVPNASCGSGWTWIFVPAP